MIRTPHLALSPLALVDIDDVDALNRAPGVLRYLDAAPPERAEVARRVERCVRLAAEHPGLARWAVRTVEGTFVGWVGVEYDSTSPAGVVAELGYRLRPELWGRGYAVEASRALLSAVFADGLADVVFARTLVENTPSRRVMATLGMTEEPDDEAGVFRTAVARTGWVVEDWPAHLHQALVAAMRSRDRLAAGVLRVAKARLDNATAVQMPSAGASGATSEHVAGAAVGVGAAEAERVRLAPDYQRALIDEVRQECLASGTDEDVAQAHVLAEVLRR